MKLYQAINKKDVAGYIMLPGIIPRVRSFTRSGFSNLACLIASIYYSVRLLPKGHPYLNPANKGRFGIRQVIAEASRHLVFKKENIDQIIIFFAVLLGFILLILQFVYLIFVMTIGHAYAGAPTFGGLFNTPNPSQDIAFMLLDSVFGIPNLFGSCISTGPNCGPNTPAFGAFPSPFQQGLQALFQYYSLAILLVAVLIFLYYVFVVVGETAMTGTPFGKRFDHIWAPIRLVVALGLLVPINYGLNSAQYITLFAAKMGSGFATNAWDLYNTNLSNAIGAPVTTVPTITFGGVTETPPPASSNNVLIARPEPPEIDVDLQFEAIAQACRIAYLTNYNITIAPYLLTPATPTTPGTEVTGPDTPSWTQALQDYNNKDIVIRFGELSQAKYPDETGYVMPLCGEITIHTKDLSTATAISGTALAEQGYYNWITRMWWNTTYRDFGTRMNCLYGDPKPALGNPDAATQKCTAPDMGTGDDLQKEPPQAWKVDTITNEQSGVRIFLDQAYKSMLSTTDFTVTQDILNRGWGGAGIWYNKIAQWNGALFSASKTIPTPSRAPWVMEFVEKQRRAHDENVNANERYEPNYQGGQEVHFSDAKDRTIAIILNNSYKYWRVTDSTTLIEGKAQGNPILDVMHGIFGTDGLFDLRHNATVNPLAQLVAIGKGIMDATIRNVMLSMGFAAVGGIGESLESSLLAGAGEIGSQFLSSFALAGLTVGFTLYYVLPFMPFIYFYFAVGSWVKAIFEAMVGVPLWALAHLKIDGTGLPGDSAANGYFMIFEIFVRPILTVFGLLASISIFSAMVRTLNSIFGLVTQNVTGFDCAGCTGNVTVLSDLQFKRNIVDEFFFTIIYAILVYMMATSSFKLIDQIPGNIMRWMGAGVQTFEDAQGDPGEGLAGYTTLGAREVGGIIIKAAPVAAKAGGRLVGAGLKEVENMATLATRYGANYKP